MHISQQDASANVLLAAASLSLTRPLFVVSDLVASFKDQPDPKQYVFSHLQRLERVGLVRSFPSSIPGRVTDYVITNEGYGCLAQWGRDRVLNDPPPPAAESAPPPAAAAAPVPDGLKPSFELMRRAKREIRAGADTPSAGLVTFQLGEIKTFVVSLAEMRALRQVIDQITQGRTEVWFRYSDYGKE